MSKKEQWWKLLVEQVMKEAQRGNWAPYYAVEKKDKELRSGSRDK